MKRKAVFFLLCFLVSFLDIEASQLSFKICGGGSWVYGGDLNKNIQGWNNYFNDRNKNPYSFDYDVKELHSLWEGGAEVGYALSSRFRVALGLEFLAGATEGEMFSSLNQEQDYYNAADDFGTIFLDEQSFQKPEYRVQSIPLTLTLYYSLPLGPRASIFLGCGGGYYSGKITYKENYEYNFDYKDEKNLSGSLLEFVDQYSSSGTYSEKSTSKAYGFHAKAGLELNIRRGLYLIIEAQGRLVDFNIWSGNKKDSYTWNHTWGYWGAFSDNGSSEESKEGKLWMVEYNSEQTGKSYPRLVFSGEEPLSSSFSGARAAKINLNGFSFRVGIKISL